MVYPGRILRFESEYDVVVVVVVTTEDDEFQLERKRRIGIVMRITKNIYFDIIIGDDTLISFIFYDQ